MVLTEQGILSQEGGYAGGGIQSESEIRAPGALRISVVGMNSGLHKFLDTAVVTLGSGI